MKVERIRVQNIKGVRLVDIVADPFMNELAGKNGAGKSTMIDSIQYALGGAKAVARMPVSKGRDSGQISLETDNLIVTRMFSPDAPKGKLKIIGKDGGKYGQGHLDTYLGDFTFDPLAFVGMKPADQVQIIKEMIDPGLLGELNETEAELAKLMEDRLLAGRAVKNAGIPEKPEAAEYVDVSALSAELQEIMDFNAQQDARTQKRADLAERGRRKKAEIERLKQELAALKVDYEATPEPEQHKPADEIKAKIRDAEEINRKATAWDVYVRDAEKYEKLRDQHEALDEDVKELQRKIKALLDSSQIPIRGVQFTSEGVFVNGIPFDQLSSAEQLKISSEIGMAKNPEFRVMFLKNGSLLDDDSYAFMKSLAMEHGYQLWVERVGEGSPDAILIEAGEVAETKKEAA